MPSASRPSTRTQDAAPTPSPATRLLAADQTGTRSAALATALAPSVAATTTSSTPTTRRLSRQDGRCRRLALGLASSVMWAPCGPLGDGWTPVARHRTDAATSCINRAHTARPGAQLGMTDDDDGTDP